MSDRLRHKWVQWKLWSGKPRLRQWWCAECGMVKIETQKYDPFYMSGRYPDNIFRWIRADYDEQHTHTPECAGVFRPFEIDGFKITRNRKDRPGEITVPIVFSKLHPSAIEMLDKVIP